MILNTGIHKFALLAALAVLLSTTTAVHSQIVTLADLTKDYDIENMISLKLSGSYKLNAVDTLDKAVKAVVTNSLETPVDRVHVTVLLSKNLQSLKQHIKTMGDGGKSVKNNTLSYTYTEEEAPGAQASEEQFIAFNQPIVKYNRSNKNEAEARTSGTIVDTLYDGPLPLTASSSIEILNGKNIILNKKVTTGIYRLAIVLSYPDKSGISLTPKITKMHYLRVHKN